LIERRPPLLLPISQAPVESSGGEALEVSLTGYLLLDHPGLNRGSAFSEEERRAFGLLGLLPFHASTMDEQLASDL
jgi:malate dehydrogenase (oxaloacetate-decarboxylating)